MNIQELLSIIQISAVDNYNQFNILYIHTYTIGHKGVVELLLYHGSDPEHRNKAGCDAFGPGLNTPMTFYYFFIRTYVYCACTSRDFQENIFQGDQIEIFKI